MAVREINLFYQYDYLQQQTISHSNNSQNTVTTSFINAKPDNANLYNLFQYAMDLLSAEDSTLNSL